ncbi:MAG: hypothetical protein ACN6OI_12830 [Flavobacterium sp.]|jgi:tetratricopeptide (TPR) repeat protein|uniref:hypothetical protein n=1 Tax=Flavobacterium sp. TaxID=239 RepID=UPI003D0C8ABC
MNTKYILVILLFITSFTNAQDYNSYITKAKQEIESGNLRKAYGSVTKAIEIDSTSIDARETRIKASLTTSAPKEHLETAIIDLNYLISHDVDQAINYSMLGVAESELAYYIYRYDRTKSNHYDIAVLHYENALKAFDKAISIIPEFAEGLADRIKNVKEKIADIKS